VFSYLDRGKVGEQAGRLIRHVEEGATSFTSILVIDEVIWILRRLLKDYGKAIELSRHLLRISNLEILPLTLKELTLALDFMQKHTLKPHDALHIACMVSNNIPMMITEDPDFKRLSEIEVLTISQFLRSI
jgi:predicted nucleic acid-binding protein